MADKLKNWENETQKLAEIFVVEVFGKDYLDDMFWVCNEIGGTLCVGNTFADIQRIIEYFKHNATPEQFFEYYDWELELAHNDKRPPINFKNFIKHGKEMK